MFYATFVELKLDSSSFMIEHSVVLCDWSLPSDWTRRFGARGCNNRHRLGQMIESRQVALGLLSFWHGRWHMTHNISFICCCLDTVSS